MEFRIMLGKTHFFQHETILMSAQIMNINEY